MTQECKVECYRELYAMFKQKKEVENLTYPESKKDYVFECTVKSVKIKCILRTERDLIRLTANMQCIGKSLEEVKELGERLADTHIGINFIPYTNKLVFQSSYPFSGIADSDAKRLCTDKAKDFLNFVINLVNKNIIDESYVNEENVSDNNSNKDMQSYTIDKEENSTFEKKCSYDESIEDDFSQENAYRITENIETSGTNSDYGITEKFDVSSKNSGYGITENFDVSSENSDYGITKNFDVSSENSDYGITKNFDVSSDNFGYRSAEDIDISSDKSGYGITENFNVNSNNNIPEERDIFSTEKQAKVETKPISDITIRNIQKIKELRELVDSLKEKNIILEKMLNQEKETTERLVQEKEKNKDEYFQKIKNKENEFMLQLFQYKKSVEEKERKIESIRKDMTKILDECNMLKQRLANEKHKYESDTSELRKEIKALSESQKDEEIIVDNTKESEITEIEDAYNCEIDQILKVNADLYMKLNNALNNKSNAEVINVEFEKKISLLKKQIEDDQVEKNQLKRKIEELERSTDTEYMMMKAMQDTEETFVKVIGEGKNIYKADIKGCEVIVDFDKNMIYIKKTCKKPARFKNEIQQLNEQNVDELYYIGPEKICCKRMITKDFATSLADVLEKINKMI